MSTFKYAVKLAEETDEKVIEKNLPHAASIRKFLPREFAECRLHECFDGELKDKVIASKLTCVQHDDVMYAIILLDFERGYRLSERRKELVLTFLDDGMADGFGEALDRMPIPDAPGYRLYFGIG